MQYPGPDVIIVNSQPFKINLNKGLLNNTATQYSIDDPANVKVYRDGKTLIYLDKIPYNMIMAM